MTNRIDIPRIVAASRFTPSPAQIRRRKEYWERNPQLSQDPSLEEAIATGAHAMVSRWWKTPGFSEWFLNKDSNLHAAEELLHRAMDRLSDILGTAEDEGIIIAAAKEARTLHAQLTAATETSEKFADEQVNQMSRKELEDYIRSNSARISVK